MSEILVKGGMLALDWGQKKVGYATSDEMGLLVTPRGIFQRKVNPQQAWKLTKEDVTQIQKLLEDFEVGAIILGEPRNVEGKETESAKQARDFAKALKKEFNIPVELVQEALTSWEHKGKEMEDAWAAASLLESFIFSKKLEKKKGFGVISLFLLLVLIGVGAFAFFRFERFAIEAALPGSQEQSVIDVPPGSGFTDISKQLSDAGINVDPLTLKLWLKWQGKAAKLRVGEYEILKSWSQMKIFEHLLHAQPISYKLTIKEGFNIYDIQKEFENSKLLKNDFMRVLKDPSLKKRMGVPSDGSLEGFLFPDTYTYQRYDTAEILIKAMLTQFEQRAMPILKSHPDGSTPEGRYKLLKLASIIEKESGVTQEQPLIASVFWNRLNKKMRLQSDPTIIYGLLPTYDGNIRKADILHPTPYNTYTIPALPIGPICNPGETALRATVKPAESNYLYFVSKGDGSHIFSVDYGSHSKNVNQFQIKKKKSL